MTCKIHNPQPLTLEQKNIAERDLSSKMKLEKAISEDMGKLFTRMNRAFRSEYSNTGRIIDFTQFRDDIKDVLRRHYRRVQTEFIGAIVFDQKADVFPHAFIKQIEDNDVIEEALRLWLEERVETQPEFILETTIDDAQTSVRQAERSLLDDGLGATTAAIAVTSFAFLRRRFTGRIPGIAISETQASSESTRFIEAQVLSGRRPFNLPVTDDFPVADDVDSPSDATKQWVTIGDSRVRSTHVSAGGQRVDMDDNFVVGGFNMRHPGDSSLGAPIREWINCRCSSSINIKF